MRYPNHTLRLFFFGDHYWITASLFIRMTLWTIAGSLQKYTSDMFINSNKHIACRLYTYYWALVFGIVLRFDLGIPVLFYYDITVSSNVLPPPCVGSWHGITNRKECSGLQSIPLYSTIIKNPLYSSIF